MTDDLTPILEVLRIKTTLFGIADLPGDWGVEVPKGRGAYFHVIYGGDGWLHVDQNPPLSIGSGDVVLLAHGTAHRITRTEEGVSRVRFDPDRWQPNEISPQGRRSASSNGMTLVCAAIETHARSRPSLLELLPTVFLVPDGEPTARRVNLVVSMLREEAAAGRSGGPAVLARLGDLLVIQLVRTWLERDGILATGWLAALQDPQIGPVLAAVHADLPAHWSLTSMAAIANLSRSRFAQRFTELLAIPPVAYVTRWRLETARGLLEDGVAIRQVARSTGYGSETTFSRAFARHHGVAPSRIGAPA